MQAHDVHDSQRVAAKIFGLCYLPSFLLVVGANFGILQPLLGGVGPDRAAQNILASATLFRIGVLGFLSYSAGVLVLSAALYVLLRPVNPCLALLAFVGRLVHGLTWLLVTLNLLTAARLLSHPEFAGLPRDQVPVLARLYLSGFDQYYVGLLFWSVGAGLGAFLLFKAKYVPRPLAGFGVVASAWCAGCTLALLVSPGFSQVVNLWLFDVPMVLFEISLSFLFLVRGPRVQPG